MWGGTTDGPVAALVDVPGGSFSPTDATILPLSLSGDSKYSDRPFFHSMLPIGQSRWLLAGGVTAEGGLIGAVASEAAYLIEFEGDLVSVTALPGVFSGRYFHSATSHDDWVVFLGAGRLISGPPVLSFRTLSGGLLGRRLSPALELVAVALASVS